MALQVAPVHALAFTLTLALALLPRLCLVILPAVLLDPGIYLLVLSHFC